MGLERDLFIINQAYELGLIPQNIIEKAQRNKAGLTLKKVLVQSKKTGKSFYKNVWVKVGQDGKILTSHKSDDEEIKEIGSDSTHHTESKHRVTHFVGGDEVKYKYKGQEYEGTIQEQTKPIFNQDSEPVLKVITKDKQIHYIPESHLEMVKESDIEMHEHTTNTKVSEVPTKGGEKREKSTYQKTEYEKSTLDLTDHIEDKSSHVLFDKYRTTKHFDKIVKSTNISELRDVCKDNFNILKIDNGDVDPDTIKLVCLSLMKHTEDFNVKGFSLNFTTNDKIKAVLGTAGAYYHTEENCIHLGAQVEKQASTSAKDSNYNAGFEKKGYSLSSKTNVAEHVTIHEFCHVLQFHLKNKGTEEYKEHYFKQLDNGEYACNDSDKDTCVSKYGETNILEQEAEAFALYMQGINDKSVQSSLDFLFKHYGKTDHKLNLLQQLKK